MQEQRIPEGLCQCGCGQVTTLAPRNNARTGARKGKRNRFVQNHSGRRRKDRYRVEDRGFDTPCWIWQLERKPSGYGMDMRDGKHILAHRGYYAARFGPIPEGLDVHHRCEVRECVNPDHLEAITHAENMRLAHEKTERNREMIALVEQGLTRAEVARRYGVSWYTVHKIVKRGH